MTFFYFTQLGAIFFYTLLAICLFAIWRGSKERIFALLVAYVFLCERSLLFLESAGAISGELMIGFGGAAAFLGLIGVYTLTSGRASRVIMFLFAAKIAMYILLILGRIEFGTMAAWTELAAYGQLAIIGSGALHADRGKLASNFRAVRSRIGGILHTHKGRLQNEGRSRSAPTGIP